MAISIPGYRIERELGEGGMGIVYLARDEAIGIQVAIKLLHRHFSKNEALRQRFMNEARMMAGLSHPNIVQYRHFLETDDGLALIMEYIDGRSLDHMIGSEVGPIPHEEAIPLFYQIVDGIGYAHAKGVLHRDIKPSNILVSREGQVKITDLGIAKIAGEKGMTRTGTRMGTLCYMAPEQLRGREATAVSDIYALGITLYEMLAGRLPFDEQDDTSELQIMNAIVSRTEVLDPRLYYPHIPSWLVECVGHATSTQPEMRFRSCGEVLKFLEKHAGASSSSTGYWSGKVMTPVLEEDAPLRSTPSGKSTPTGEICPKCRQSTEKTSDFCDACGEKLIKECPQCKGKIRWNKAFCPVCGTDYERKKAELAVEAQRVRIEAERRQAEAERKRREIEEANSRYAAERERIVQKKQKLHEERLRKLQEKRERNRRWWHRHWWKVVGIAVVLIAALSGVKAYLSSPAYIISRLREGMTFVQIPSGNVSMGSPSSESDHESDEGPVHTVSIQAFELMTTEVTQGMWEVVMWSNPASGYGVGSSYPVYNVSWNDCQEFIEKLNSVDTEYEYRLPSEAEWEYACRAGTTTAYYWGGSMNGSYCWCEDNSSSTNPVAQKLPNAWGLYDMSGNVWEWCEDYYHNSYSGAPTNGSAWLSPSDSYRVFRGGSWSSVARFCRSADRGSNVSGGGYRNLGLRLARSAR